MTKVGDSSHTFAAYFKRTASPAIVLAILRDRPMYGYEITAEIARRSGGKYTVSVLYPILTGLVEDGYIAEEEKVIVDGRARRYYRITPSGLEHIKEARKEFLELSEVFLSITEEK